jgi:hypothetical protein
MRKNSFSTKTSTARSVKKKRVCLIKMKSVVVTEDLGKDQDISCTTSNINIRGANGKLQIFSFDTVLPVDEASSQGNNPTPIGLSLSPSTKFVSLGFDSAVFINGRPRNSGPEIEASIIEDQVSSLFSDVYPESSSGASDMNVGSAGTSTGSQHPVLGELIMKRHVKVSCYEIFDNKIIDLIANMASATIASPTASTNSCPRLAGDAVDGLQRVACVNAAAAMDVIREALSRRTCMGVAQDVAYIPDSPDSTAIGIVYPTFVPSTSGPLRGFGTWTIRAATNTTEPARVQLKGFKNGRLLGPVSHVFVDVEVEQHVCVLRAGEMRRRASKLAIVSLAAAELLNYKPARHETISFVRSCDFNADSMKKDDGVKMTKKLSTLQVRSKKYS